MFSQQSLFYHIHNATDIAKNFGHGILLIEHILLSFLLDNDVKKYLVKNNINYDGLLKDVQAFLISSPQILQRDEVDKIEVSAHVELFTYLFLLSEKCNTKIKLDTVERNILLMISSFLLCENTYAEKILNRYNLNYDFITNIYQRGSMDIFFGDDISKALESFIGKNINEINDIDIPVGENGSNEFIKKYTINLTEKVRNKDWIEIVGRTNEIDLLSQIILRHDKPNAILVGNPGVGKTKIVEGFAKSTKDYVVYQLDTLGFMSSIMVKGELERRVKSLTDELMKIPNSILYIDEIHSLCANDGSGLDVASLLKPIMTDNSLKIIGSTTFEEYRKYIEKDDAFTRRFYKMVIEEPSYDETKVILKSIKENYEEYYGLKFSEESIDEIMNLTNKFVFDKHYPDKAIDLLDMAGAYVKHNDKKEVQTSDVQKVISKMRNIPLSNISQSEEDIYKHLEDKLKEKIFGQDEAVEAVANAVIISRSGLRETSKTAVSLMLLGASGVGKTEICKQLSEIMSIPLIRFDMSEYMEEHSVSKLIGSPPGYKDSGNGKAGNGLLINAIDENPHCVLLLDEIEKANSKIHNLLLQVMDNGKLTSSMGKQVSFENVFLIMTSNTGSYNAHKQSIGFGNSSKTPSQEDYEQSFLPEFRNRIDKTITFNNLDNDVMTKICQKFLDELKEILLKKGIDFKFKKSIIEYIVNKASDENNGAREMKHIITNEIKNVIAKNLVFGNYKNTKQLTLTYKDKIQFGEK